MTGDRETEPLIFRQHAERRILTVAGTLERDVELTEEQVLDIQEKIELFMRTLARPILVGTVRCELPAERELRVVCEVDGVEAELHGFADEARGHFGDIEGVDATHGSTTWHLSTPPSMRHKWQERG